VTQEVALLDLLDWKRRVFGIYAETRAASDPQAAWIRWREARDELFASHPQSPLPPEDQAAFLGHPYFDYDPGARVLADIAPAEPEQYDIATSGEEEGTYGFTRFAHATFKLEGKPCQLELYWLDGYGGGLFLSFRDGTSGSETYGAGRYLLDTVKGADLGMEGARLVLDFNFAYNPSCAYDPQWVCPLVPSPNRLTLPIRAGERFSSPGH
jgi:uncharacterized protein (DUF1684 family)